MTWNQSSAGAHRIKNISYSLGALNFVGVLAVIVGSRTEHVIYLAGVVLLLPGSVLSSLVIHKWEQQDFSIHWNCCGTNSPGTIDLLYLPLALLLNIALAAVILWLIGLWKDRSGHRDPVVRLQQH
jgi:hypothetical protein